jgi:hypothetical protein
MLPIAFDRARGEQIHGLAPNQKSAQDKKNNDPRMSVSGNKEDKIACDPRVRDVDMIQQQVLPNMADRHSQGRKPAHVMQYCKR